MEIGRDSKVFGFTLGSCKTCVQKRRIQCRSNIVCTIIDHVTHNIGIEHSIGLMMKPNLY